MTEYWVSQGNKWCDFCKIFISNNPSTIRNHELGQRHKDNVAKKLANMRKENAAKDKEQKEAVRAIEQIEADRVTKKIIGRGYESGGLYFFDHQVSQAVACPVVPSPFEVHCRLGHPSLFVLKKLYPEFRSLSSLNCDSCQFAKFHRLSSSPRVDKRAIAPFELVHSDIWGPCPVVSQTGFRYFVTFVDDHSRLTWLYLMKNRSELLSHFCAFHTEIKNQFNVSIKTLRTDNAGEYFSHSLGSYLCENGIIHQSSCADTPSQNGVAERKNRHLLETARALSFQMHVSKIFWVDAVSTACFLINRMPSSVLNGEIPYRVLNVGF
ncbi:uncharacterized protein LOC101207712 isoform X1 [Cucumis sativus]|uniref:uncharacterized protein LOC101207712 isoform X1 n=1 Tax=Cucumis sativus TaxID=3659 RepID=UPI0012F4D002|nr:uncharacterized protein LOC101207712 isoform X1 [Cucumis sativus]